MSIRIVGVVGLGNMGLPMAASLARQGFEVLGFDLSAARRDLAAAEGIRPVAEAAALLQAADAVVSSLPYGRDVEALVRTPGGLLARRDRRVTLVDTSTADPGTSRRLAALLEAAGHGHLDAPVSGGPAGAAAGQLTMMVGGSEADVAAAQPVLAALSATALHVGPSGAGNVAKLINNMLVAAHLITNGEAFRLAEAAGVKAEAVLAVVNAATGRSAVSEAFFPKWVIPGRFDSGFAAGLMRKDVGLAAELAREVGLDLPLSGKVAALWADSHAAVPDAADFTRMADFRPRDGG
ncbi:NAD(P)-dependent oxidoreductase [Paeniroseomonas aquatica]|uniref:NAD(P)-dependent oxidoreductase n=1 Tax=Paeniroseomonas aquatica TaxID=373043 RepID=A0ABT8A456_9PROT|nr:NAD(P)-dependent oxidoreductase [Paeniroseomonas aquatica]MDN3564505.1 NAD(P)-dependent oxidoreductase [Paeniroseomonas aquatica]